MKLNLLKFPHDILKMKAKPVTEFNDEQRDLIEHMKLKIKAYGALGLAAPQVGYSLQIIVCQLECGMTEMINPQMRPVNTTIITNSGMGQAFEYVSTIKEGCLSMPKVFNTVKRFKNIEVTWDDKFGNQHRSYFHEKDAVIIQHEIDHLAGVMFIDRLGTLRSMVLQKYFKANRK